MITELNFTLHPAQQQIFTSKKRFKVVGAGRRFGKSYLARVELIIKALEMKREVCESAYLNLESQVQEYDEYIDDCDENAKLYEEQIKIKEDMIKTIKPKWYHNRYLWFFGGVFFTSSTVYLAGQLD